MSEIRICRGCLKGERMGACANPACPDHRASLTRAVERPMLTTAAENTMFSDTPTLVAYDPVQLDSGVWLWRLR